MRAEGSDSPPQLGSLRLPSASPRKVKLDVYVGAVPRQQGISYEAISGRPSTLLPCRVRRTPVSESTVVGDCSGDALDGQWAVPSAPVIFCNTGPREARYTNARPRTARNERLSRHRRFGSPPSSRLGLNRHSQSITPLSCRSRRDSPFTFLHHGWQ